MPGGIYLIRDKKLVRMEETDYDSEKLLQELLASYPDLMAGDQINSEEPRRWLLIQREVPITVEEIGGDQFSLDHLFLDQDGVPTLVEVKRSSDTRLRREVVGQMLDYAANAVLYWPVDKIIAAFEARCKTEGREPGQAVYDAFGVEVSYEDYWQQVKTNLLAKRIRLIFVADEIPGGLRRIVAFLNETMDPVEVLAVEIRQYTGEQHQALVPRVLGQTKRVTPPSTKTNEERFLASWDEPNRSIYARLLDFAKKQQLQLNWGTKGFTMNVLLQGRNVNIFEGYPPPYPTAYVLWGYILGKVRDPDPIVAWYRNELEKLKVGNRTSKGFRLTVQKLSPEGETQLHQILSDVVQMIGEHGLKE
jgi:hypothetical protein